MLSDFFQGIIPGLILSAAIGPVFFMLVQTSIQRGFNLAMTMECGSRTPIRHGPPPAAPPTATR